MTNHSSANCGFQTRCLKCGEDHRTNQCLIMTPRKTTSGINCGVTGHIVSWRGCPLFPKIKPTKGQRGKLQKSAEGIPSFSIQETRKYILLNATTKVNTPAGRTQLPSGKQIDHTDW
ncbi:hypothetical protein AVEN_5248-1 [Araneus ventricosus]|uniref:Pre-C2HC domain-containing protein n=1 Tax=Araneus ventricosus TaxID=182803 RepID=A0A4Y2X8L8_ARAVE|nr:hypothetical protein AVEN_5248-1 [Araneus ventricosus]